MKKLMFAAFAAATVAGTAFAAAPEPAYKVYNLTVTTKHVGPAYTLKTQRNIPTNEVEQAWADAEAAAPSYKGSKNFYQLGAETNKKGKVTIVWQQYKPAKNGTNIVAATTIETQKDDYLVFMDKDNTYVEAWSYVKPSKYEKLPSGFKYRGFNSSSFLTVPPFEITDDGKAYGTLKHEGLGMQLAGIGKAAKTDPDKNAPYDYAKSVAGNVTTEYNGAYGTWKWSYDKKLSKVYQDAIDAGQAYTGHAIELVLESKKILKPEY